MYVNSNIYQHENMAKDRVCAMMANKNWAAAKMEHEGPTYYFCVEKYQGRFAQHPDRYTGSLR